MKKTIVVAMMLVVMCGLCYADDPNSMPNPPKGGMTSCVDEVHNTVTLRYSLVNVDKRTATDKYEPVSDVNIRSWVNDPVFLSMFQDIYNSFPSYVRRAIRIMANKATWEEARSIYDRVESEKAK